MTYREAFVEACDIDPLTATVEQIGECAHARIPSLSNTFVKEVGSDRQAWLDLLLSHIVIQQMPAHQLTVIHHYPAEQAALARLDPDDPQVAERFEVFAGAVELANGYHELTDADEQRQRFAEDNLRRLAGGLPEIEPDSNLLAALESGLPDCCGVAVGFDRLIMVGGGSTSIDAVTSFSA